MVAAQARRSSVEALPPDAWLGALIARHTSAFGRPEFLKAVRALSSRYVENRAALPSRSPVDSAGKRAAFAGFYAPLHYLTTRALVRELPAVPDLTRLVDLGCGTGVAGAAWADVLPSAVAINGVDHSAWALDEMRWNCQQLGLACRTHRTSLGDYLERETANARRSSLTGTALVCGWSVNELNHDERSRALASLLALHRFGACVLIIEPIASSAVPWWAGWRTTIEAAGGRSDEWRFPAALPDILAELDEAAGFRRDHLTARSFWLGPTAATGTSGMA